MRFKVVVTLAFTACFLSALSQPQMFQEAFTEFATQRLWEVEAISIQWKMEGPIQADLNEGLNNLLEHNPLLAESNFSAVIKKDSSIWEAHYYRGAARKQLKKFWLAGKDMKNALRMHGDFYEGLVELAKIQHFHGESSESEKTINKAIRLRRDKGTAYYLKGDINMSQLQWKNAANDYRNCLESDSAFHDARVKLALLDAVLKKDEFAALPHLNNVLQYDSLHKTALLFRSILLEKKDRRQSIRDLSNVILVSPHNTMALYFRGLYLAESGEYERAFNDFHKVIQMTATSDNNFAGKQSWIDKKIDIQNAGAYVVTRVFGLPDGDAATIKKAFCLLVTQKFQAATRELNNVYISREPLVPYLRALTFEHGGFHKLALQQYEIALAWDNTIAEAYKKRGIYRQELKQWQGSVDDFSVVLKHYPDAFINNKMRGVSYYHLGSFKSAIEDFTTYLKNDSTNKEILGSRGMAYLNDGQHLNAYMDFASSDNVRLIKFSRAMRLVDSVLNIPDTTQALKCLDIFTHAAPQFSEGYVMKFKIHIARGEWDKIDNCASRALINRRVGTPASVQSYLSVVMGMSLSRIGQFDEAIKNFTDAIELDNQNDVAYLRRADLFLSQGKTSKAKSDLQRAAALGSKEAEDRLATIH